MNIKTVRLAVMTALMCILAFAFVGCGKKTEEAKVYNFEAKSLAKEIAGQIKFEDTVEEVENDSVAGKYELENLKIDNMCVYMSTTATAEEMAVFVAKDDEELKAIEEKCNARIKSQISVYESYAPKEAQRLKDAYLKKFGNVLVMCVGSDAQTLDKIINGFLENNNK